MKRRQISKIWSLSPSAKTRSISPGTTPAVCTCGRATAASRGATLVEIIQLGAGFGGANYLAKDSAGVLRAVTGVDGRITSPRLPVLGGWSPNASRTAAWTRMTQQMVVCQGNQLHVMYDNRLEADSNVWYAHRQVDAPHVERSPIPTPRPDQPPSSCRRSPPGFTNCGAGCDLDTHASTDRCEASSDIRERAWRRYWSLQPQSSFSSHSLGHAHTAETMRLGGPAKRRASLQARSFHAEDRIVIPPIIASFWIRLTLSRASRRLSLPDCRRDLDTKSRAVEDSCFWRLSPGV